MNQGLTKIVMVLACVGTFLAGSIYYFNNSAIEALMREDSMSESDRWTQQLVKNVPDVEAIISGGALSSQSKQYLEFVASNEVVDHFDIYSKDGQLKLESERLGDFARNGTSLADHNPEVLEVAESGEPFTLVEGESENGEERIIAETYLPIVRDGRMLGIASVYVDQTEMAARLQRRFTYTSLLVGLLSALGFSIPALGVILEGRRRRASDSRAAFLARHDALTGLPNRQTMEDEMKALLNDRRSGGKLASLHFIDIDNFKDLNDRFGHAFGDEVLRSFASRLKETLHGTDIAARFGGDEFLVIQTGFTDIDDLGRAVARLNESVKKPFEILGKSIVITSSIGTAISPANGTSAAELMSCADIALYVVKSQGRNGQRFFQPEYLNHKKRRSEIELLVREHAAQKTFEIHYQPLYHLQSSRLKGFEALLRMRGRDGNLVPPIDFISVAEEIGLIDEIGTWVLLDACRTASLWPIGLQVSVNLSAIQFRRKSVVKSVSAALAAAKLEPERLLLEVTESLLMSDIDGVLEQLNALKALGVSLAMDDFGTGYSSLSYMVKFPFDRIKIDKSFVHQMASGDSKSHQVVQTIVALGHNLKMAVTAEGVETAEQEKLLGRMQCDDVQGYLYSKPVPATDIAAIIAKSAAALNNTAKSNEPARMVFGR